MKTTVEEMYFMYIQIRAEEKNFCGFTCIEYSKKEIYVLKDIYLSKKIYSFR